MLKPHLSKGAVLSILLWVEESSEGDPNQHYELYRDMSPGRDPKTIYTASKVIRDMEGPAMALGMRMRKDTYKVFTQNILKKKTIKFFFNSGSTESGRRRTAV